MKDKTILYNTKHRDTHQNQDYSSTTKDSVHCHRRHKVAHNLNFYGKQDCTFLPRQDKRQFYTILETKETHIKLKIKNLCTMHYEFRRQDYKLIFIHYHMSRQERSQDLTQITRLDTKRRE